MSDRPQGQDVPLAHRRGFVADFALRRGRIVLRKTGNSAAIDGRLIAEVAIWLATYLTVRLIAALRPRARRRAVVWFTPDVPHPRYMVRIAAIRAGITVARDPADASASFYFDDATVGVPPAPMHDRAFNFACADISKGRVARVFAEVFGYPLTIDPARWHGPAVEKSEANGAHDGRIVECPRAAAPGRVYERLIDTVQADGFAYDLRTQVVDGRIVAVWAKRRAVATRFLPPNLSAERLDPAAVFSVAEQASITAFARAMGADWCGLDILRDEPSGRIYIVDVNKTDAGPIIALPFRDKLASIGDLAAALQAMVARPVQSAATGGNDAAIASTRASRAA